MLTTRQRIAQLSRPELEAALTWARRPPSPAAPTERLRAALAEAILDGAVTVDGANTWGAPVMRPEPGDTVLIRTAETTGGGLRYHVDDVVRLTAIDPDGTVRGTVLERRTWHPLQPRAIKRLAPPPGVMVYAPGEALIVERIES